VTSHREPQRHKHNITRVKVRVDPKYREIALKNGYDVEPFDARLLATDYPWMFWHRVKPLTGRHCAPIDLPPMFNLEVIK
jgi:hypothetical protein